MRSGLVAGECWRMLENAGELVAGDFPHPADPCRLWIPASGRNYTRPVC